MQRATPRIGSYEDEEGPPLVPNKGSTTPLLEQGRGFRVPAYVGTPTLGSPRLGPTGKRRTRWTGSDFGWLLLAVGGVAYWSWARSNATALLSPYHACDPLAQPGEMMLNLTVPLETYWAPYDQAACPVLPDYLGELWKLSHDPDEAKPVVPDHWLSKAFKLMQADTALVPKRTGDGVDPLRWLKSWRKRRPPTVLIIGDSVDRNGLIHFCQLMRQNVTVSLYEDIKEVAPWSKEYFDLSKDHPEEKFHGWDQRGLPHFCTVPDKEKGRTAVKVVNAFHYGMDALDEFNAPGHTDWHPPGRFEARMEELFLPFVDQIGGAEAVDLILLHSGMWDLALFGMQDEKTTWDSSEALTAEQLAWWLQRMRTTVALVRQHFPDTRIVLRLLHRTNDLLPGTTYIKNLRVHQLRHLQLSLAHLEKLPVFDYGHLLEGYQLFQEKVHPMLIPGGVMYAQNMLNQLRIALEGQKGIKQKALAGVQLRFNGTSVALPGEVVMKDV